MKCESRSNMQTVLVVKGSGADVFRIDSAALLADKRAEASRKR